jgi:hypothetical protein
MEKENQFPITWANAMILDEQDSIYGVEDY